MPALMDSAVLLGGLPKAAEGSGAALGLKGYHDLERSSIQATLVAPGSADSCSQGFAIGAPLQMESVLLDEPDDWQLLSAAEIRTALPAEDLLAFGSPGRLETPATVPASPAASQLSVPPPTEPPVAQHTKPAKGKARSRRGARNAASPAKRGASLPAGDAATATTGELGTASKGSTLTDAGAAGGKILRSWNPFVAFIGGASPKKRAAGRSATGQQDAARPASSDEDAAAETLSTEQPAAAASAREATPPDFSAPASGGDTACNTETAAQKLAPQSSSLSSKLPTQLPAAADAAEATEAMALADSIPDIDSVEARGVLSTAVNPADAVAPPQNSAEAPDYDTAQEGGALSTGSKLLKDGRSEASDSSGSLCGVPAAQLSDKEAAKKPASATDYQLPRKSGVKQRGKKKGRKHGR